MTEITATTKKTKNKKPIGLGLSELLFKLLHWGVTRFIYTFYKNRKNGRNKEIFTVNTNNAPIVPQNPPIPIQGSGASLTIITNFFSNQKEVTDIVKVAHKQGKLIHPNVIFSKFCKPFLFKMKIRSHLTNKMWKAYENGKRQFGDYPLPDGLKKNDPLPEIVIIPILTEQSYIAGREVNKQTIIKRKLATRKQYDLIAAYTKALFRYGVNFFATKGLKLVDAKFEFGVDEKGDIYLIGDIFTPRSARIFYINPKEENELNPQASQELIDDIASFSSPTGATLYAKPSRYLDIVENFYRDVCNRLTGWTPERMFPRVGSDMSNPTHIAYLENLLREYYGV